MLTKVVSGPPGLTYGPPGPRIVFMIKYWRYTEYLKGMSHIRRPHGKVKVSWSGIIRNEAKMVYTEQDVPNNNIEH
jgi:hypothetical protein